MATRKIMAGALKPIPAKPVASPTASVPIVPVEKIVRRKFSIPESEYQAISLLKQRSGKLLRPAKKSEIVRAGLKALHAMSDRSFARLLGAVPKPKEPKAVKEKTSSAAVKATAAGGPSAKSR